MADQSQFGQKAGPGGALRCEEWEALLTDALDGLLPASQAAAFAAHSESCENCGDLLAHVKQGQQWLEYLHTEPEVPAGIVGRILEKTVGAGAVPLAVVAAAGAPAGTGAVAMAMPWRRSFHETRLLMTVAMAFFSLALTLNLVTGGHLTSLRLADLKPSQIGNTVSREFYGAQKQVVQYYHNLRFVYELQSRMRELRRDVETQPPQQQPNQQQQKPAGKDGSATAVPERGRILHASETAAFGSQRSSEQRIAASEQRAEQKLAVNRPSDNEGNTTAVVMMSLQTGKSISLGLSLTGLRRANVERGLV